MENTKGKMEMVNEEAIQAASRALQYLKKTEEELSSAKKWGIWDIMAGGIFSTMIKHSRMDNAKTSMEEAKKYLSQLKQELAYVEIPIDFQLYIGEFLTFADYFFDDPISEIMVQSRMNDALEQVREAMDQVEYIRKQLEEQLGK